VTGVGFLVTSAISGFLVAWDGIRGPLVIAIALSALSFAHLLTVHFGEPAQAEAEHGAPRSIDIKGTIKVVAAVPGLFPLIFFSTFNNLLGGVFMALMDAYGLSLMEVQEWGLLWAL